MLCLVIQTGNLSSLYVKELMQSVKKRRGGEEGEGSRAELPPRGVCASRGQAYRVCQALHPRPAQGQAYSQSNLRFKTH